jgi:transposase
MAGHLAECARHVAPDARAVVLLDREGGRPSSALVVADNVILVALPACAPELTPAETIWQVMRDTWLWNRVFRSYDDVLEHCRAAWNRLVDQPWTIIAIGHCRWAHRV